MEQQNKNLIYALYKNCANELFSKSDNVKQFITLLNGKIEINREFVNKLLALLSNLINNPRLIIQEEFTYHTEKYENICKKIDDVIIAENKALIGKTLNNARKNDYLTILQILLTETGKITDIDTILSQYEYDYDLPSIKINIDNFINIYNNANNKTILDILQIISTYQLYKIFNPTDTYQELTILSSLYNVLTNAQLLNVVSYRNNIYNLCMPFTNDNYNDIVKSITSGIYNNIIPDLTQYNFEDKSKLLFENGIIPSDKNLFQYVLKSIIIGETDISKKNSTFADFITNAVNKTPVDIYDSKELNIQNLLNKLNSNIQTLFNKISEYNQLGSVITNKCDDVPIKDILILFSKNIDNIKDISEIDKSPILEFSNNAMTQLFGDKFNDIFKPNKSLNILQILSKIYSTDGKLNITELEKTFNDYIYVLIQIFSNFQGSYLSDLYQATQAVISIKQQVHNKQNESVNILMFGDTVLFEEDTKSLTVNASQFGSALVALNKEAETSNKPLLTVCKEKINNNDDNVEKNNKLQQLQQQQNNTENTQEAQDVIKNAGKIYNIYVNNGNINTGHQNNIKVDNNSQPDNNSNSYTNTEYTEYKDITDTKLIN